MPDILIRNVDPRAAAYWKKRANEAGRSLQAELKEFIESEADTSMRMDEFRKVQERLLAATAKRPQTDSTLLVRQDRDR